MQAYKDIIKNVLDNGTKKPNRTGIDTISVTGTQFRHDMRDGFPLVTLKKTPFKLICVELEGFIKGITDKKWYEDRGCYIWSEWANPTIAPYGHDEESKRKMRETRDLGPIYGYQLRNFNKPYKPVPQIITPFSKDFNTDDRTEYEIHDHPKYGSYIILDSYFKNSKSRFPRYNIKFIKTGYEIKGLKYNLLKTNQFSDPYKETLYNVACLGDKILYENCKYKNKLKKIWNGIISRCYNINDSDYKNYGAKGVYVHNDWLIFSNFVKDVQQLENWNLKKENWSNYTLDKDKYSLPNDKCYSKKTCHWADNITQRLYSSQFKTIKATNIKTGKEIILENMKYDCKKYGFTQSSISRVINGQRKRHKGFIFERIEHSENCVDQLKNIIEKLNTDPLDRRMVASYWNPKHFDKMALLPCHYNWQVLSDGKYIDLVFTMRSVDTMLGMSFDIAHYGMLLTLLGLETGLIPKTLVGNFADTHIYENHLDAAREVLTREPLPLPVVEVPGFTSIFDWTYEQRKLIGYKSHDKIQMDVAV